MEEGRNHSDSNLGKGRASKKRRTGKTKKKMQEEQQHKQQYVDKEGIFRGIKYYMNMDSVTRKREKAMKRVRQFMTMTNQYQGRMTHRGAWNDFIMARDKRKMMVTEKDSEIKEVIILTAQWIHRMWKKHLDNTWDEQRIPYTQEEAQQDREESIRHKALSTQRLFHKDEWRRPECYWDQFCSKLRVSRVLAQTCRAMVEITEKAIATERNVDGTQRNMMQRLFAGDRARHIRTTKMERRQETEANKAERQRAREECERKCRQALRKGDMTTYARLMYVYGGWTSEQAKQFLDRDTEHTEDEMPWEEEESRGEQQGQGDGQEEEEAQQQ